MLKAHEENIYSHQYVMIHNLKILGEYKSDLFQCFSYILVHQNPLGCFDRNQIPFIPTQGSKIKISGASHSCLQFFEALCNSSVKLVFRITDAMRTITTTIKNNKITHSLWFKYPAFNYFLSFLTCIFRQAT